MAVHIDQARDNKPIAAIDLYSDVTGIVLSDPDDRGIIEYDVDIGAVFLPRLGIIPCNHPSSVTDAGDSHDSRLTIRNQLGAGPHQGRFPKRRCP